MGKNEQELDDCPGTGVTGNRDDNSSDQRQAGIPEQRSIPVETKSKSEAESESKDQEPRLEGIQATTSQKKPAGVADLQAESSKKAASEAKKAHWDSLIAKQHRYAGWAVFCRNDDFIPSDFKHALWIGNGKDSSNWVPGEEGRVHYALEKALTPTGAFALVVLKCPGGPSAKPMGLLLFGNQEDGEYALATHPGAGAGGCLRNLWVTLPGHPLPQYTSHLELHAPAGSENGRAVFGQLRKYGEIGVFRWKKSPIDLRTEDEKEADAMEEADMDLGPRTLRIYQVYFRQSEDAVKSAVEQAERRPRGCDPLFKRHIAFYSVYSNKRPPLEPVPLRLDDSFQSYRMPLRRPRRVEGTVATSFTGSGSGSSSDVVDFSTIPYKAFDWVRFLVSEDPRAFEDISEATSGKRKPDEDQPETSKKARVE